MVKRRKCSGRLAVCLTALSAMATVLVAGCTTSDVSVPGAKTAPPITVEIGGAALTAGGATAAAQATGRTGTLAFTQAPPTPTPIVLDPGTEVVALGKLRIYTNADPTAAAMAEYAAESTFRIIEPGGDFGEYPVEVNGVRWYRVRAEDGLAGWIFADGVGTLD